MAAISGSDRSDRPSRVGRIRRVRGPADRRYLIAAHALVQALLAALLIGAAGRFPWPTPLGAPVWLIAAAFFAAEATALHIEIRREAHSISLSAIPLLLGLVSLTPGTLVAARLVGSAVTLMAIRRRYGLKLAWNLSLYALETGVATLIAAAALRHGPPSGFGDWLVVLVAVLTAELVSLVSVPVVIMLAESELRLSLFHQIGRSQVLAVANAAFGVVTVAAMVELPLMAVFAAIPLVGVALLLRLFGRLGKQHHDLQQLHRFTTAISGRNPLDPGLAELTTILRSVGAALAVPDGGGTYAIRLHRDGTVTDETVTVEPSSDPTRASWTATGSTVVTLDDATGHPASALVKALRGGRGLALPVDGPLDDQSGSGPAYIVVFDRLGTSDRFSDDEVELFGSLAAALGARLSADDLLDRLETQARIDALTGLANRTSLEGELERRLAEGRRGAVLVLDLDRFKDVNDSLGHAFGDRLLCLVADRLRVALRATDLAGRLGGDEFAVLVEGDGDEQLLALLGRLADSLNRPVELDGISLEVASSIGLTAFPGDAEGAAELLRLADIAMYEAKRTHQSWVRYEARFDHASADRLALVGEMRQAIADGSLRIHLQPQIRTADEALVGAEALLRWYHPERGLIPPVEFVPLVEQSSLAGDLTRHVIARSLEAARLLADDGRPLRISVNLTARDLLDRSLAPTVAGLLTSAGVAPEHLAFEVTEGSLIIDIDQAIATLDALRALGCRTSVDDFGTGYASLQYLQRLPVDEVKIDRSFVRDAVTDPDSRAIVTSTTRLLRDLELEVVAEGVEDEATFRLLRDIRCDVVQGYLHSPPLPIDEFRVWAAAHEADRTLPTGQDPGTGQWERRDTSRCDTSTSSPERIS